ncbi:MAG: alpha/beta hydrolase [Lachnospiraceae bacterium]|nr:alpha/beta hydrolase [Lachnospiraceae bacterium]
MAILFAATGCENGGAATNTDDFSEQSIVSLSENTNSPSNSSTLSITETSSAGENINMNKAELLVFDERRAGTSEDTVATPDDFPEEYNYGSGKASDWSGGYASKRMPLPSGNQTVLNTAADPAKFQALYLWETDNVPAVTNFTENMTGYFDEWNFRPYVTAIPLREGVKPKGAVVLMAGGAYQFRGNFTDSLTTAAALRELGFQTFVVDYRLRPYNQEEGALDVARAVRFIRKNADIYGIDPNDVAVMGFSAGGIQAGEFLMHYDENVNGTKLDPDYVPDELDARPAHAAADGMIYSFYGWLSVGNMDPNWLAEGNLPPTFYVYGTEDPFYRQFEQQYQVIKDMGLPVSRIVLDGWPHGFGSDGGWVKDYADWLESVFANN